MSDSNRAEALEIQVTVDPLYREVEEIVETVRTTWPAMSYGAKRRAGGVLGARILVPISKLKTDEARGQAMLDALGAFMFAIEKMELKMRRPSFGPQIG